MRSKIKMFNRYHQCWFLLILTITNSQIQKIIISIIIYNIIIVYMQYYKLKTLGTCVWEYKFCSFYLLLDLIVVKLCSYRQIIEPLSIMGLS